MKFIKFLVLATSLYIAGGAVVTLPVYLIGILLPPEDTATFTLPGGALFELPNVFGEIRSMLMLALAIDLFLIVGSYFAANWARRGR